MCSEKDETSVDLKAGEENKKKFCYAEINLGLYHASKRYF